MGDGGRAGTAGYRQINSSRRISIREKRGEDGGCRERLRRWKWERSYRYDRIEATGTPGLNRSRRWVCTGEKGGGRRMGRGLSYAEVS